MNLEILLEMLLFYFLIITAATAKKFKHLESVHVIFRHGDRTPEAPYPKDPHANQSFYPVGYGELTNMGKNTVYDVGVRLRNMYGPFLGDIYTPNLLEAWSSETARCKMSMELVSAGLFPPKASQIWNKNIKWQPIPYNYLPKKMDKIFWPHKACPRFEVLQLQHLNSQKYLTLMSNYTKTVEYLKEMSGLDIISVYVPILIHSILTAQEKLGLEPPLWAEEMRPEIEELSNIGWRELFGVEDLKILGGGFFMSKIMNDVQLKINSDPSAKGRKIYLYSAHDTNLVAVLVWLNAFKSHSPKFGAHIIFEIYNKSGERFIKIHYQNYEGSDPKLLQIPNCKSSCRLSKFKEIYAKYLNPAELCN